MSRLTRAGMRRAGSLTAYVAVQGGVDPNALFAHVRDLIHTPDGTIPEFEPGVVRNPAGVSADAWLKVKYGTNPTVNGDPTPSGTTAVVILEMARRPAWEFPSEYALAGMVMALGYYLDFQNILWSWRTQYADTWCDGSIDLVALAP